jgi:hypothetical protein
MAAVSWPASLGSPVSAEKTIDDNLIVTKMEAGPTKRRRRYTARADGLSLTYRFDDTQASTWLTFFGTTIADGAIAYDMTDPIGGGVIDVAIIEPPRLSAAPGGGADLSLRLEVQP